MPNLGDALMRIAAATNGANSLADYDLRQKQLQMGVGGDIPSAIQEYNFYSQLSPEEQQRYMSIKRAQQVVNLGGTQGVLNPSGTGLSQQFPVTPRPEQMPEFQGQQAAAQAAGKVTGETAAEAKTTLPDVKAKAEQDIANIDALLSHKGLSSAVGLKGASQLFGALDEPIAGTEAAGFNALLNQLKGGTFLQAYQDLKGGGQITEVEGQKAEQAKARLSTAQSEEEFKKALNEYKGIIQKGLDRFSAKAGAASQPQVNLSREQAIEELKRRGILK